MATLLETKKLSTFSISTGNQYISGYVDVLEHIYSDYLTTNTTTVEIQAYLCRTNNYTGPETSMTNVNLTRYAYIGSEKIGGTEKPSYISIPNGPNVYTMVYSASTPVNHNNDGKLSGLRVGFEMYNAQSFAPFTVNLTETNVNLTAIPRFANVTVRFLEKTETVVSFGWSSDAPISATYYSATTENTKNYVLSQTSVGATSGVINIPALSPNTWYYFNFKFTRQDSGQDTEYGTPFHLATYQYPYVIWASENPLVVGNKQTLHIYNPLNREITLYMKKDNQNGTELYQYTGKTGAGESVTFFMTPDAETLYNSFTGKSANVCYYCYYSSINNKVASQVGTIVPNEADCTPVITRVSVRDTRSVTSNLTLDKNVLIKGFSSARVTPITGKISSEYDTNTIENGLTYTINGLPLTSSGDVVFAQVKTNSFEVIATNSRGYTAKTIVDITDRYLAYINVTIAGDIKRPQQVGDEMVVNFSGTFYNDYFDKTTVNPNTVPNDITIKYYVRNNDTQDWVYGGELIKSTDFYLTTNGFQSFADVNLTNPLYYKTNDVTFENNKDYYTKNGDVYTLYTGYTVGDTITGDYYVTGTWNYQDTYEIKLEAKDVVITNTNSPAVIFTQIIPIGQSYFSWWRKDGRNNFDVHGNLYKEGKTVALTGMERRLIWENVVGESGYRGYLSAPDSYFSFNDGLFEGYDYLEIRICTRIYGWQGQIVQIPITRETTNLSSMRPLNTFGYTLPLYIDTSAQSISFYITNNGTITIRTNTAYTEDNHLYISHMWLVRNNR